MKDNQSPLNVTDFIKSKLDKIINPNYTSYDLRFGTKSNDFGDNYFISLNLDLKGLFDLTAAVTVTGEHVTLTTTKGSLEKAIPMFIELEKKLPKILNQCLNKVYSITNKYTELDLARGECLSSTDDSLTVSVYLENDPSLRRRSYSYIEATLYPTLTKEVIYRVYYSTSMDATYTKERAEYYLKNILLNNITL